MNPFLVAAAMAVPGAPASPIPELPDPRHDWVMQCQGCHLTRADGVEGRVPPLSGSVSRFLRTPDGRAYLARVPGVAFAPLPDDRLARLLNWVVRTFDPVHVPVDFQPYSAGEVKRLRAAPLVGDATTTRHALARELGIAQFSSRDQ